MSPSTCSSATPPTEHGHQGDTVTTAIAPAITTTTRRDMYVAATRGQESNEICVVTERDNVRPAVAVRLSRSPNRGEQAVAAVVR